MNFYRSSNHRRTALFEYHPDTGLHEQAVAVTALGTFAAKHYHDAEKRIIPAKLGVIIAHIEVPDSKQHISMQMLKPQAEVLGEALDNFLSDSSQAVRQFFLMGNPHGSSVRAVEHEMAGAMLEALSSEFKFKPQTEELKFGFN